jgi:hypothetical protein
MHSSFSDLVHSWHDFHVLVGTAAATLVGLMFVTGSIGANLFTEKNAAAMRAFISPTVVHFSAVLFICILATIPSHTAKTLGVLILAIGAAGLVYTGRLWMHLFIQHRFKIDVVDRMFYALLPVLGHLLVLAAALLLLVMQSETGLDVLAAALITLLAAGIRNAWDMTLWIVIRTPATGSPGEAPG